MLNWRALSAAVVCVCVCVSVAFFLFFHFGPFSPSVVVCGVVADREEEKRPSFELEIGKEDEKKKKKKKRTRR